MGLTVHHGGGAMRRTQRVILVITCAVTLVMAGAPTGSAVTTGAPVSNAAVTDGLDHVALQAALDGIVEAGMPGTFAEVRDGQSIWRGASGVADMATGRPVSPGFQHRVGSITKTFVATTLLQLVGEGEVKLDAPVDDYLPELGVPPEVTVRMLLNHTSGIGNYTDVLLASIEDVAQVRATTFTPQQLAALGLSMPSTTEPGGVWSYSNTNYILAGMIIEEVTGRPVAVEVTRRIVRPLRLRDTYFPGGLERIVGPHSKAYAPMPDGQLQDFSVSNMSWAWAAGALISSTRDLNTFYAALLNGRLLRPEEFTVMRQTVPMDPADPDADRYGLGVYVVPTPCGEAWGHDGLVIGHSALSLYMPDSGRQVTIAFNLTHYAPPGQPHPIVTASLRFLQEALCEGSASQVASFSLDSWGQSDSIVRMLTGGAGAGQKGEGDHAR